MSEHGQIEIRGTGMLAKNRIKLWNRIESAGIDWMIKIQSIRAKMKTTFDITLSILHNTLLRTNYFFFLISKLDNRIYRKNTSTIWRQTYSEHWLLQLSCGQHRNIGHGVCESFSLNFRLSVFRKLITLFSCTCTQTRRPNYRIYFLQSRVFDV